jgi:hypothetical protein
MRRAWDHVASSTTSVRGSGEGIPPAGEGKRTAAPVVGIREKSSGSPGTAWSTISHRESESAAHRPELVVRARSCEWRIMNTRVRFSTRWVALHRQ